MGDIQSETFISVDVEAAGPIPGTYSLLSIGACVVGDSPRNFYVELKPINDAFLKEAIKVAGKSIADFSLHGKDPQKAMESFKIWIEEVSTNSIPIFVGFNATFDWAFVNWYFHTFLNENPFGIGGIDIKSFYMGMVGCSWKDTRSSLIPDKFKGGSPHTHNALDDAIEQAVMFELMRKAQKK